MTFVDPYYDILWGEEQLKRFTYKPGWSMRLDPPKGGFYSLVDMDPTLQVRFKTEDTYSPGRTIEIGTFERFPMGVLSRRDEKAFAHYLQDALFKIERHESQEWLRRDGVIFNDPHKR